MGMFREWGACGQPGRTTLVFLQRPGEVGPLFRGGGAKTKFEDEIGRRNSAQLKLGPEDEIRH